LTTKFTRCTAASLGALTDDCFQLSVISSQLHHYTPCKLYSATLLLARMQFSVLSSQFSGEDLLMADG